MTASARLAGGALVLIVYAWALKPSPAAMSPAAADSDAGVEKWLALSNDAYAAGRYADALEPTSRLVDALSGPAGLRRAARAHLRKAEPRRRRSGGVGALHRRVADAGRRLSGDRQGVRARGRSAEIARGVRAVRVVRSAQQRAAVLPRARVRARGPDRRRTGSLLEGRGTRSIERRRPARSRPPRPSREQGGRGGAGGRRRARALSVQRRRAAAGRTRGRAAGPAAGRAEVSRACARGRPRTTSTCTSRSAGSRPAPAGAPRRGVTSSAPSNWIRRGARSSRRGSSASPRIADADRLEPRDRRRVLVRHGGVLPAQRHSVRVGAVPQAGARAGARHVRGTARVDLARRARRLRGGACALAAVGPSRRARVRRRVGAGRRGAVLRAAAVAARAVDDRAGARAAVARAAGVDRLDGSAAGAHRAARGRRRRPTRCPATLRPARWRRSP